MKMSGQHHAPPLYIQKVPLYPSDRGLRGPHSWSGAFGKEKSLLLLPRFEPLLLNHMFSLLKFQRSILALSISSRDTLLRNICHLVCIYLEFDKIIGRNIWCVSVAGVIRDLSKIHTIVFPTKSTNFNKIVPVSNLSFPKLRVLM
jgi:hypothetical protein